jgi:hypothetical protein
MMMQSGSEPWVEEEFQGIDLGDKRLDDRLMVVAQHLSEQPMFPINQDHEDWAETKAAYRFFQNEKVSLEKILAPHQIQTKERIKDYPLVLAVQDTTLFNYNGHPKTQGLGCIMKCGASMSKGLVMHSTMAFTPKGLALGILSQRIWSRDPKRSLRKNAQLSKTYRKLPTRQKESYKWFEAFEQSLTLCPAQTHLVTVADRESDIFDLMALAQKDSRGELLIRVCRNRQVEESKQRLWEFMKNVPSLAIQVLKVPARGNQPPRKATVSIRFAQVTLKPAPGAAHNKPVSVGSVFVQEVDPPRGVPALEWMLLSTTPVNNLEEAQERIQWYRIRWGIEQYHRILKSGCQVERCKLQTAQRL